MSATLRSLANRIRLMNGRGTVLLSDDSKKMRSLQVSLLKNETPDDVEDFEEYGFTRRPKKGAEVIVLCIGGDRSHPVVIKVSDRRYRKKDMEEGEVAMYTDEGDYIHMKRGRIMDVFAGAELRATAPKVTVTATTEINFVTPDVKMSGGLTVEGPIKSNTSVEDPKGTMEEMRGVFNNHTQTVSGGVAIAPTLKME